MKVIAALLFVAGVANAGLVSLPCNTSNIFSSLSLTGASGKGVMGSLVGILPLGFIQTGEQPAPRQLPVVCPPLANPAGGKVSMESAAADAIASYTCDKGFRKTGGSASRTCVTVESGDNAGELMWNGAEAVCTAITCTAPSSVRNGRVQVTGGSTYGSMLSISCDNGFMPNGGVATRICNANGQWFPSAPAVGCEAVKCPCPMNPVNGRVTFKETIFGSVATYVCDDGFVRSSGDLRRTCQANGKWSGQQPVCGAGNCNDLQAPANGRVTVSGLNPGSTATYSCNEGYELRGDTSRTCNAGVGSGLPRWNRQAPTCAPVDCGRLQNPSNGRVQFTTTNVGSKAQYSCNAGFTLAGAEYRTCASNGRWTGVAARCEKINCGPLPSIQNGKIDVPATTVDSVATYSCNEGYNLQGDETRVCQASGRWFGLQPPSCVPVDCGALEPIQYGFVEARVTTFGAFATYSCQDSFELRGDARQQCQADGKWSPEEPPKCVFKCEAPGFFSNPFDCTKFNQCRKRPNGEIIQAEFDCPDGTLFNEEVNVCDDPLNIPETAKCLLNR